MLRDVPLLSEEIYHVYNRGAHKELIFKDFSDYRRFSLLLYLANSSARLHLSNTLRQYQGPSLLQIYESGLADKALVDVLAYCLMPNHFHLLLRQKAESGVSQFMKKLMTGYSMYFNLKHDHSGVLFQGRFKSRHVNSDEYFRYIFSYIHLNPMDLFDSEWKEKPKDPVAIGSFLKDFDHSSYPDYSRKNRPEREILSIETVQGLLGNPNNIDELLSSFQYDQYQGRSLI